MARVWERMDSEYRHYAITSEQAFQSRIRTFTGDYFQTLSSIDPMKRQAMISHTLLIDDDSWNVNLARRAGYMAYQVNETGLELSDWKEIVKAVECRSSKSYSSLFTNWLGNHGGGVDITDASSIRSHTLHFQIIHLYLHNPYSLRKLQ